MNKMLTRMTLTRPKIHKNSQKSCQKLTKSKSLFKKDHHLIFPKGIGRQKRAVVWQVHGNFKTSSRKHTID